MGINGIGNHLNQSGVYGKGELEASMPLAPENNEANQHDSIVVTEARARVSFAVATPQLADAMNLTPDERQEFIRSVEKKVASASLNLGHKSVMLDLYAVMELIRSMSQKLSAVIRDMNKNLNLAAQKNLRSQAEVQRKAAKYQMVGSFIVGGFQAVMSIAGTWKQIESLNVQSDIGKQLGANVAKDQLELAKTGGQQDLALKQLNNVKKEAPAGFNLEEPQIKSEREGIAISADEVPEDVQEAKKSVGEKQEAFSKLVEQKLELQQKIDSGTLTEEERANCNSEMNALDGKIDTAKAELVKEVENYNKLVEVDPGLAQEQVDKFEETAKTDKELAEALKNQKDLESRHEQERMDLAASEGALFDEDSRTKLDAKQSEELATAKQRVAVALEKVAQGTCVAKYEETPKGQAHLQEKYHEAMLSEVDGYKKDYEKALDRSNSEKRINGKESVETERARKDAAYRYKLARAEQVYESSKLDKLPPDAPQRVVNKLTSDLVDINNRVRMDLNASGAEKTAAFGMLWQGLSNSVGGMAQKALESFCQSMQADITDMQSDDRMLQEQREQLKETLSQILQTIVKALELYQSVISKESQSQEEIINALRA